MWAGKEASAAFEQTKIDIPAGVRAFETRALRNFWDTIVEMDHRIVAILMNWGELTKNGLLSMLIITQDDRANEVVEKLNDCGVHTTGFAPITDGRGIKNVVKWSVPVDGQPTAFAKVTDIPSAVFLAAYETRFSAGSWFYGFLLSGVLACGFSEERVVRAVTMAMGVERLQMEAFPAIEAWISEDVKIRLGYGKGAIDSRTKASRVEVTEKELAGMALRLMKVRGVRPELHKGLLLKVRKRISAK